MPRKAAHEQLAHTVLNPGSTLRGWLRPTPRICINFFAPGAAASTRSARPFIYANALMPSSRSSKKDSKKASSTPPPPPSIPLEICVDSIASALAASKGGASRLEVCDNLIDGGTTPSIGLIKTLLKKTNLPIHAMVRPRGGDFLYSSDELDVMRGDIKALVKASAHGIVLGVLTADGKIDEAILKEFVEKAAPLEVTFHRAIDVSANPIDAIKACVRCGCHRVLTSGGAPTAPDGIATLRQMVDAAGGQLIIAAGGGVSESNCASLAAESRVDELHGSLRVTKRSGMVYRPVVSIPMGAEKTNGPESEYETKEADEERIAAVVGKLCDVPPPRREGGSKRVAAAAVAAPSTFLASWRQRLLALDLRWPLWVLCFAAAIRANGKGKGLYSCTIGMQ